MCVAAAFNRGQAAAKGQGGDIRLIANNLIVASSIRTGLI